MKTDKNKEKYAIAYCYSCHREAAVERGGEVFICPFCGDDLPSKRVDKYYVSDAAGKILVKADERYKHKECASAADLYKAAAKAEDNNPYAHLCAALADFEVILDGNGEPISHKKTDKRFEDDAHYKRALELVKDTMRGEWYKDLGAKIDGLYSVLDYKTLERRGFEYVGTQLDRYGGKDVDVSVPEGTTHVNTLAFYLSDNVQSVHIPASVIEIGVSAFSSVMERLTVDENNKNYRVVDGCLIDKRTKKLVYACAGINAPAAGVEIIGKRAFDMHKTVESISIPEGVKTIEGAAFDCCSAMKSVSIPSTVTKIEQCAFVNCYKLEEIELAAGNPAYYVESGCLIERESGTLIFGCIGCKIPSAVKTIGVSAFGGDHKALHFPASVERGLEKGFCGCETLEKLSVAEGNKTYYSSGDCIIMRDGGILVRGCEGSVIPDDGSVKRIGENAFSCSKGLVKLTVPHGVISIEKFAFSGCSGLREIDLPDTLEEIDSYAFEMCYALKDFRIPNGVKTLGVLVFEYCENLESLYIPSSVVEIYECINSGCKKLKTVVFEDKNGWTANDAPIDPDELEGDAAIELLDSWVTLIKRVDE